MQDRKDILKIILAALTAVFILAGISTAVLSEHQMEETREQPGQEARGRQEGLPTATPAAALTPAPSFTPTPAPSPTPVPTRAPAFAPADFQGAWYSADGTAWVNIYELDGKSVSFFFSRTDKASGAACQADVTAEVAGNASEFSFIDSCGNSASGNLIFDHGQLFVRIHTVRQAEDAPASPDLEGILQRERPGKEPSPAPAPTVSAPGKPSDPGEYFFPDSDSRYLTDEELSRYSSEDLELAKNEIYARHGRRFVTQRMAGYFNEKTWYQGTVDPEAFDAMDPESVFNEYELANISKLAEGERRKNGGGTE